MNIYDTIFYKDAYIIDFKGKLIKLRTNMHAEYIIKHYPMIKDMVRDEKEPTYRYGNSEKSRIILYSLLYGFIRMRMDSKSKELSIEFMKDSINTRIKDTLKNFIYDNNIDGIIVDLILPPEYRTKVLELSADSFIEKFFS